MKNLIWYACYGSNIHFERFKYYIIGGIYPVTGKKHKGCKDKTLPIDNKPIIIPFEMYFGLKSKWWEDKGVSFLDFNKKGITLGRMYLVSEQQFEEINHQEGSDSSWYNKIKKLGEYEGYPIKTFSNTKRVWENEPSQTYLDIIRKGIFETYPMLQEYSY